MVWDVFFGSSERFRYMFYFCSIGSRNQMFTRFGQEFHMLENGKRAARREVENWWEVRIRLEFYTGLQALEKNKIKAQARKTWTLLETKIKNEK
jgi:uncharacterized protein YifE (UPF0438 family)